MHYVDFLFLIQKHDKLAEVIALLDDANQQNLPEIKYYVKIYNSFTVSLTYHSPR